MARILDIEISDMFFNGTVATTDSNSVEEEKKITITKKEYAELIRENTKFKESLTLISKISKRHED